MVAVVGPISFWGRWIGGFGVPTTARSRVVGWPDAAGKRRRYYRPEVLEELLRQQEESGPFTRQRYERLLERAAAKARATANKTARKAVGRAVAEAELVPIEAMPDPALLMATIEMAISAKKAREAIEYARHAETIAKAYREEIERDDAEVFELLSQWMKLN